MPSALIFIADGTEEMEFTITYDTLTRAGIKCTSVFVGNDGGRASNTPGSPIATCSRGVKIVPDATLDKLEESASFDILIVPGGAKGAETISRDPAVQELVRNYSERQKIVGMICAGSLAALTAGLHRQPLTSHPSIKGELETSFDYREESVVVSGNLVTSRGPGTAFLFALKLIEFICGNDKRSEVEGPMVFPSAGRI